MTCPDARPSVGAPALKGQQAHRCPLLIFPPAETIELPRPPAWFTPQRGALGPYFIDNCQRIGGHRRYVSPPAESVRAAPTGFVHPPGEALGLYFIERAKLMGRHTVDNPYIDRPLT